MNTIPKNYVDVDMTSFAAEVIEASRQQLVMIDFWADWCGPCRSLAPILENLVVQYQGKLKLVKIDTDAQQDLAAQFGIRSLPTVFFFKDGKPVDQFMGVQPESAIREIIDRHVGSGSGDSNLDMVRQAYDQGQKVEAKAYVQQLIAETPDDDEPKLLLMEWLVAEGDLDAARVVSEGLSEKAREGKEYKALLSAIELRDSLKDLPSEESLIALIAADENDLQARYQLAQRLVAEQKYAEGLEQLLEIVRRDRNFNDDCARIYMIRVFELLGGKGELVSRYRGLLARTLN